MMWSQKLQYELFVVKSLSGPDKGWKASYGPSPRVKPRGLSLIDWELLTTRED